MIVSCCVYAATLVSLYAASTALHSVSSPRWARPLEAIDHCCIYLLIAGTYTPITLVRLRGGWGWTLFGLIWGGGGLCFLGVLMKVRWFEHVRKISTPLYVAMGLLVLIAFKPLLSAVRIPGVLWLIAGGAAYIAGVGFNACGACLTATESGTCSCWRAVSAIHLSDSLLLCSTPAGIEDPAPRDPQDQDSQPPVEPSECTGKHERHDQDARPEDKHVPSLAQIEAADTADKQVADGKVEEAP